MEGFLGIADIHILSAQLPECFEIIQYYMNGFITKGGYYINPGYVYQELYDGYSIITVCEYGAVVRNDVRHIWLPMSSLPLVQMADGDRIDDSTPPSIPQYIKSELDPNAPPFCPKVETADCQITHTSPETNFCSEVVANSLALPYKRSIGMCENAVSYVEEEVKRNVEEQAKDSCRDIEVTNNKLDDMLDDKTVSIKSNLKPSEPTVENMNLFFIASGLRLSSDDLRCCMLRYAKYVSSAMHAKKCNLRLRNHEAIIFSAMKAKNFLPNTAVRALRLAYDALITTFDLKFSPQTMIRERLLKEHSHLNYPMAQALTSLSINAILAIDSALKSFNHANRMMIDTVRRKHSLDISEITTPSMKRSAEMSIASLLGMYKTAVESLTPVFSSIPINIPMKIKRLKIETLTASCMAELWFRSKNFSSTSIEYAAIKNAFIEDVDELRTKDAEYRRNWWKALNAEMPLVPSYSYETESMLPYFSPNTNMLLLYNRITTVEIDRLKSESDKKLNVEKAIFNMLLNDIEDVINCSIDVENAKMCDNVELHILWHWKYDLSEIYVYHFPVIPKPYSLYESLVLLTDFQYLSTVLLVRKNVVVLHSSRHIPKCDKINFFLVRGEKIIYKGVAIATTLTLTKKENTSSEANILAIDINFQSLVKCALTRKSWKMVLRSGGILTSFPISEDKSKIAVKCPDTCLYRNVPSLNVKASA
uniref:Uncharacterized protein n=1 Tax=Hubei blood fluke virus 3 TaxID=1922841 RepID=A0A1L3KP60_9VIRU|nr:hypothetical protein 4 [Hubei blood fluke virus 3]